MVSNVPTRDATTTFVPTEAVLVMSVCSPSLAAPLMSQVRWQCAGALASAPDRLRVRLIKGAKLAIAASRTALSTPAARYVNSGALAALAPSSQARGSVPCPAGRELLDPSVASAAISSRYQLFVKQIDRTQT